jgi:uracil-DNA glycosylase
MTMPLVWNDFIEAEKQKEYFGAMLDFVESERQAGKVIYPPSVEVFNAFTFTPLSEVRVVIIGQDPYHGPNQAHGLCFSVQPEVKVPPSLVNIYKELKRDIPGFDTPTHGYLKSWAEQGVLLLNTVLTVEQGKPHSHAKIGWEPFTDRVIEHINESCDDVIFLLWGAHAQKKGKMIDRNRHVVLSAAHPSPLSAHRGFLGCGHFSQVNHYLVSKGKSPIDWQPTLN